MGLTFDFADATRTRTVDAHRLSHLALAEARELGISGVPFFVVDRRFGVSGMQPVELFADVLHRAWCESRTAFPADSPV